MKEQQTIWYSYKKVCCWKLYSKSREILGKVKRKQIKRKYYFKTKFSTLSIALKSITVSKY